MVGEDTTKAGAAREDTRYRPFTNSGASEGGTLLSQPRCVRAWLGCVIIACGECVGGVVVVGLHRTAHGYELFLASRSAIRSTVRSYGYL